MRKAINTIGTYALLTLTVIANALPDKALITWSTNAALSTFNYDALSYQTQLENLQPIFTKQGWDNFNTALTQSGNLQTVIDNKLVVSAYKKGESSIISFKKANNTPSWVVKIPTIVSYSSEYIAIDQSLETFVSVIQTPTGDLRIDNINSTLVAPSHSASNLPKPRPGCKNNQ